MLDEEDEPVSAIFILLADTRGELAYKKLRGDELDWRDLLLLEELNALFKRVLPKPRGLPKEVLKAIEEVEALVECEGTRLKNSLTGKKTSDESP